MNTSSNLTRRVAAVAAATLLLLGATTLSASARPDPGEAITTAVHDSSDQCSLERVDTQYVSCDNLTGNGVPAPMWIPEY